MMAPSRGPSDPQPEIRSASNSTASSSSTTADTARITSRRLSGALERRLSNVVDVEDASRLMECSQIQRQIRFQHLVRRYISQILYGCNTTDCTTPTCLSCNKRRISRPFRAPTQLTARALAHFLASQDNPHHGLCPHQLNVDPDALEIEGASDIEVRTDGSSTDSQSLAETYRHAHKRKSTLKRTDAPSLTQYKHQMEDSDKVMTSVKERVQTRKDKSLGQNLYDTVTIIYSYSKQIPSPLSVFASLRSPPNPRQKSVETHPARDSNVGTALDRREISSDVEFTARVNGHVTSPNVNKARTPAQTTPPHSQRPLKTTRRSSSTPITIEVLSNGQRIHKVHHNLADTKSNGHASLKIQDPTSFDGTLESSCPQTATMKKKPTSLVVHSVSNSSPVTLAPLASSRDDGTRTLKEGRKPTLPVAGHLNCDIMDQLKEDVYQHRNEQSSDFNFVVDYDTNRRFCPTKPFVNRSMFFTLSDPETLLKSFRDTENKDYENSPLPHLKSTRLSHAFRDWNRRNGALIFDSLWIAVEALFRSPPELDVQKSPRLKPSRKKAATNGLPGSSYNAEKPEALPGRYLNNEEAAHIVMICIHALTSLVSVGWPHTWVQLRKFRSWGIILPDAPPHTDFTGGFVDPWLSIIDELEYEPALRLADRLVRGIGARMCFEQILATLSQKEHSSDMDHPVIESHLIEILVKHLGEVEGNALAKKSKTRTNLDYTEDPGWTVTATFMEWLRTIIIKKWDGKADVNRWSSIGAAVILMDKFHTNRDVLNLRTHMFYMPILHEHLDSVSTPLDFLTRAYNPNLLHLFQYPCLFPPDYLVAYFRTINFTEMFKHFERTERAVQLQRGLDPLLREPYWWQIRNSLKTTFSDYLVLDVKRESALKDTLDQLWRAERRLLLKPLKVKMGMQEGEVGLDQGGVTSEFFRVVLNEAFKPDNGMFTIDPVTSMTYFQPCALEPLYKFELLGILFSLAIYNGITLPVTFPIAFYHNLMPPGHPCLGPNYPRTTDFIRDGWPQLAKSFDELVAWTDGDVEDVFYRSYEFSFQAFGRKMDVDMQGFENRPWPAQYAYNHTPILGDVENKWPTSDRTQPLDSPAWERPMNNPMHPEPAMVSNANRIQYVADYILWLTQRSVGPQLRAFKKGFMACLNPKSLELFTPGSLRSLVEGTQIIDIEKLREATRYEAPYTASHPTIILFWSIVEAYDQDDQKRLLEFVTASVRVPVTGFGSMQFVICRAGADSRSLPTSSTCFGKLMLPEYKSKEKMKEKLDLAIRNAQGFGIV